MAQWSISVHNGIGVNRPDLGGTCPALPADVLARCPALTQCPTFEALTFYLKRSAQQMV